MKLQPIIRNIPKITLIGQRLKMSFANNRTTELWQQFMPRQMAIESRTSSDLFSVEIYPDLDFFKNFNPHREFEKWAAAEVIVAYEEKVPRNMEILYIPAGLYVVFLYKGRANKVANTYRYVLTEWLPNSPYSLDDRPHFAIMGEKYKNDAPESEEELWFPLKMT